MMRALKMTADRMALSRRGQVHDVQRARAPGTSTDERRRDDREILGDVVGDAEGRQRAARDQELLADLDDLDELRRVRVEVHHVAGLLGRLRAGVHGDADVGLRQRGRVVGAVAGHRDQVPAGLLLADQGELRLRAWPAARKSSTPASAAMAAAVSGLSPVIITVLDPHRARSSAKRSLMPPLTMSLR